MKREPIKHEALPGLFARGIKLSERLRWHEVIKDDQHVMIPALLAICVVDANGEPVRSLDEWDEWAGENMDASTAVFNQCVALVGTVEAAAKIAGDDTLPFQLLLVRTLGYRSLTELREQMDSAEYALWQAEFERSPWDERRADLRAGIVAATVADYAGKSRKSTAAPAKPLDFMPYAQERTVIEPDGDYLKDFINDRR